MICLFIRSSVERSGLPLGILPGPHPLSMSAPRPGSHVASGAPPPAGVHGVGMRPDAVHLSLHFHTIDEFVTGGVGVQERAGRRPEGIVFLQLDVP